MRNMQLQLLFTGSSQTGYGFFVVESIDFMALAGQQEDKAYRISWYSLSSFSQKIQKRRSKSVMFFAGTKNWGPSLQPTDITTCIYMYTIREFTYPSVSSSVSEAVAVTQKPAPIIPTMRFRAWKMTCGHGSFNFNLWFISWFFEMKIAWRLWMFIP